MSDIAELFDRDPLLLSSQDIDTIVAYFREARAKHQLGLKTKKVPPPKGEKIRIEDLDV
jgi:hypothetical protein